MNLLQQKILDRIKTEGPISFKTFMETALYEPELGYYASRKKRIGRSGDFYTSSHVHPAFGIMIGKQIEELWETMGRPDDFKIIELGPGAGYLCKDMLEYYKSVKVSKGHLLGDSPEAKRVKEEKNIFKNLQYTIVEMNPAVRENQKKILAEFSNKIKWVSSLSDLNNIKGCFLSNELLDAFPVHILEMDDEIKEVFVSADDENFKEIKKTASKEIIDYVKDFSIKLKKGYRTEINLEIKKWLSEINRTLTEGFILTIDYGYSSEEYYSEDRDRGTLLCYHDHQITEDPYKNIGEQDITAHVNFSSLKKWGEGLGIKTIGFCKQGAFLVSAGIDSVIEDIHKNSEDYPFEIAKIKKLILPGTLGETHNVMIQYKGGGEPSLKGFEIKNQMKNL